MLFILDDKVWNFSNEETKSRKHIFYSNMLFKGPLISLWRILTVNSFLIGGPKWPILLEGQFDSPPPRNLRYGPKNYTDDDWLIIYDL